MKYAAFLALMVSTALHAQQSDDPCDFSRVGYNQVHDDQGLVSEHSEGQTAFEAAVNLGLSKSGEEVIIRYAPTRVICVLPANEEPEPDPDPDPEPDPDPPAPGGTIAFQQIDTPSHGNGPTGSNAGWFGVHGWREGPDAYVALHDHNDPDGNDPQWRWDDAAGAWVYHGQMSQVAQIRHSDKITLAAGEFPTTGGQGFGSGRNDTVHFGGQAHWICVPTQYYMGACHGYDDVNGDGIDDILRSDGVVINGATLSLVPASQGFPTLNVIGSNIPVQASASHTKPVCMWLDRVLTGQGLFDLQGNSIASLPAGDRVKGGFACGDTDQDGVPNWVFYSEGGDDSQPGGTSHLLSIENDQLTELPLGGLPAAGGQQRRFNLSVVADFNSDGLDDLVLPDHGKVYQANADMTFTEVHTFPRSTKIPLGSVVDFNGDQKPDLCVTPLVTQSHAVCYLNVTGDAVAEDPDDEPVVVDPPADGSIDLQAFAMTQYRTFYKNRPYSGEALLYDPFAHLYTLCDRTGDAEVCADAKNSSLDYIQHYVSNGLNAGWSGCNGGWNDPAVGTRLCDVKMTYVSPLYFLETVEGISADRDQLARLEAYLWEMGEAGFQWKDLPADWDWPSFHFTERRIASSVSGMNYLCMLGQQTACDKLDFQIAWLADFQDRTPTGFWLHSYNRHEGSNKDPDRLIASPWMSAHLGGALVQANAHRANPLIPPMLRKLAQAQLDALMIEPGSWLTGYNQTNPRWLVRYIYVHDDPDFFRVVQDNKGWKSDTHNIEVWCAIKAGGLEPPSLVGYEPMAQYYYDRRPERPATNYRVGAWGLAYNPFCYDY